MSLSEASRLRRLGVEIAAARTAWVIGLPIDALARTLASGTELAAPSGRADGPAVPLVVVAVRAVAQTGAITPTLPREHWPSSALLARASRLVAVVLPTPDAEPPGGATGRALATELPAAASIAAAVDRVLTVDAVLDRDDAGFVVCELVRGLSARQLQTQVTPSLRISPTLTELEDRAPEERC
jgi:hypothetical protein